MTVIDERGGSDRGHVGVSLLLGAVLGALAGAAAYVEDGFDPMGRALVAAAAALGTTCLSEAAARRNAFPAIVGVAAAAALAASSYVWFRTGAPPGVADIEGGCEPFTVYAQNRWDPRGAAVREQPWKSATKVGGYDGNELVTVDGWVRTAPPYPHNPEPFNSDLWFHVADQSGWVAFAALRADSTPYDPTGLNENGGRPIPVTEECSGVVRD